jgi:hypothetical protein
MDDLTLLRKFEPVLQFNQGELFFPSAVDGYLERCSLWKRDKYGNGQQLAAEGELSAEKLGQFNDIPPDNVFFLRLVNEPMDVIEYQKWLLRPDRPSFPALGRMARVGLLSRIIDSFVEASFLIRGAVPGGTTAGAEVRYRDMLSRDPRYSYYARVIHEGGYIILHYIFFYFMNDFRSTFDGINDHESDWEQLFVYVSDEEDPVPLWVAYSSHDFKGDDLRRRWDDPELQKIGTHPISFPGGGSHSNYFLPGDYLISVEPKYLHLVNGFQESLRHFWSKTLGQGTIYATDDLKDARLVMPYIDYARGDGLSIGPEQEKEWTPIILTEKMAWAEEYRGLWGLDTKDRFEGENGPAGPKFNRDGTVRQSWNNPLGFAGLNKVAPPNKASTELKDHIAALSGEYEAIEGNITEKREKLRLMELEVQALQKTNLDIIHKASKKNLDIVDNELNSLYGRRAELTELLTTSESYLQAVEKGDWGDPQAHITVKRYPEPPLDNIGRFASYWAAISGALLLFAFAALFIFLPSKLLLWAIFVVGIFLAVEAAIWRRFTGFLLGATILLAIVTTIILIFNFLWQLIILGLIGIVVFSLMRNLKELRLR